MAKITVNSKFDAGSIEIVDISKPEQLVFKIRNDTNSHFKQWFYFQLNGIEGEDLHITLTGLKDSAYPTAWKNYKVCMSYDNQYWTRLDTKFDGDNLKFVLTPEANSIYFAYFEPYSYMRHLELIGFASQFSGVTHEVIGQTHEGRNLDLLVVGKKTAKHKIWIIARQHPGETMAEWFMEGLIHKLLDGQDSIGNTLLKDCVFYLVPNMNPDGAYNGNLRTNSTGTNLNREWANPSVAKSPEVYYVRKLMQKTGVTMFFDIHGDEDIPYVFTAGCEENLSYSKKQAQLGKKFTHYFELINPDYQTVAGYEIGHFSDETMTLATNWIGDKFDCLAFTIEMPFKDNDNLPDKVHGWDGRRSYLLGQSLLTTVNLVLRG